MPSLVSSYYRYTSQDYIKTIFFSIIKQNFNLRKFLLLNFCFIKKRSTDFTVSIYWSNKIIIKKNKFRFHELRSH